MHSPGEVAKTLVLSVLLLSNSSNGASIREKFFSKSKSKSPTGKSGKQTRADDVSTRLIRDIRCRHADFPK